MNRNTLISRINKSLTTKSGEIAQKYESDLSALLSDINIVFRPFYWRNKGRGAHDSTQTLQAMLEALKLPYTAGNDAPRGGRDGDYIVLASNAKKSLRGAVNGLFIYKRKLYCYDGELAADTPVSRNMIFDLLRYKSDVKKVMGDAKVLPFSDVKNKMPYRLYDLECMLKIREIKNAEK